MRVIARLNMGGPALHVAYLSAGLRARGYATTLVAGSLARGEESMSFVAEELGVQVISIAELHREISPLRDALAVVRLARLIRLQRPHVLHTHTAKAGAIGRLAAVLAGDARPAIIVHTFHGHVLRGYFGPFRTALFSALERWLARVATVLVAVSPEGRDDLVRLGVERRAKQLGIVRHCLFLGYQEDVAPFYAAFDALVLPSANEGTPVSVIEALASARPVVATRVGGVPDVVRDGEEGFLVETGDTGGLAERLTRLARDPELRRRLGRSGRGRVLSRYAVERLLDDVDRLYRELLATNGG